MHHNFKAQLSRLRLAVSFAGVACFSKLREDALKLEKANRNCPKMEDLVALVCSSGSFA